MTLLQNERQARHSDIKEHVDEVSHHLGLQLGEKFDVLSTKKRLVYSVDNMILLEETFQKVVCIVIVTCRRCDSCVVV